MQVMVNEILVQSGCSKSTPLSQVSWLVSDMFLLPDTY
jgi:hypothetical protein